MVFLHNCGNSYAIVVFINNLDQDYNIIRLKTAVELAWESFILKYPARLCAPYVAVYLSTPLLSIIVSDFLLYFSFPLSILYFESHFFLQFWKNT